MNKEFGFKSLKGKVLFLLITGLIAFVIPSPGGLLSLIIPISLVLFIVGLVDLVRYFVNQKRENKRV